MSIALVVTAGFGNGTFSGTIKDVVLRGYSIGEVVVTPDSTFGVFGLIQGRGQGVLSAISANGQGILGAMSDTFGVSSSIQERGKGVTGTIDENGQGVDGEI